MGWGVLVVCTGATVLCGLLLLRGDGLYYLFLGALNGWCCVDMIRHLMKMS